MTLISDIHVLSGILEDKSINSFTVEIGGKTFEGIINPETKIITVDVPTRLTSNNDVRENKNLLSPAEFNAAKTALTPVITASPNAVVSGLGEAKDFTNPQEYTVTAPDGSTTTYTAIVEETIIKRSQNIQGASMIIPGQGSYAANRHSTPIGGTLGDGVWEQVGVVHEGTQIAENSPARIEMVADPENENLKVLRMNKTVSGQAFKLVSTGAFSNLPGITRFTTQVRMRFNDISAGDGFYMMLANRDNVIFKRNAAGTGFILRSRSAWNTAISDIPTKTKDFNFDQWYTFTFVNYNVNNGNGTFTNTMEVYVDGELEAIRTSNHASDITFSARHMEFNCFANTLFDMYWSDMSITFKMQ